MRHPSPVVLAVAAACVLSGCTGGGADSSGGGGDDKTLTYLIEALEGADELKRFEGHLADFTKDSGIEVKIQQLDLDTMRTVLQTRLRSEEGPDVFNWGSGPGIGGALADAGLLYDLTDAYAEHDWEIFDFAKERVTYGGKIYGIPGEVETVGLYYNVKVFDDLGIEPPTSLDELRDVSEKIREGGLVPMAFGDQEGWEGSHLLSMALSSDLGPERMDELLAGKASWDSPEVVDALAFWQEANDKGWLPESPTSVDYDTMTSLYISGEAAMIPTGSWLVNDLAADAEFESAYISFPSSDDEGVFAAGLGSGPFVAANTGNPEGAIELLDFLASEEHAQWTVENLKAIPARPVDTDELEVDPLLAQVIDQVSSLSEGSGDLGSNIDVLMPDSFNEAMYNGVQAVLTGQSTPEEVAASLQTASEQ